MIALHLRELAAPGTLARRATQMGVIALFLALLSHLGGAIGIEWWYRCQLHRTAIELAALQPLEPQKKLEQELQYMLVEPTLEDEEVRPEEAVAMGRVSRAAQEEMPDLTLRRYQPKSMGESPILPLFEGTRGRPSPFGASTPSPPLVRAMKEDAARRSELRKDPPPRPSTASPSPDEPLEPTSPFSSSEPSPQTRQTRKQPPPVRQIGARSGAPGTPLQKRFDSSAMRAGIRQMAILRSRYGTYLDEIAKRLQEAVHRQEALAPVNLTSGIITTSFRIDPDGRVVDIRILSAPEAMLTERMIARAILTDLQSQGPFPPPSPDMLADKDFNPLIVNFWFLP